MQPEFPNFQAIELADMGAINRHTAAFPCISDFDFHNLWSWNFNNELTWCMLNGNLVVTMGGLLAEKRFCTFLGNNELDDTLQKLFLYIDDKSNGIAGLELVPEPSLVGLDLKSYTKLLDEGGSEYVYDLQALSKYKGAKFASKRNLLNVFTGKGKQYAFKRLDFGSATSVDSLAKLNLKWESGKTHYYKQILNKENIAFNRLFKGGFNDIVGYGVFDGDDLIGYCINSLVSGRDCAVGLHLKLDPEVKGLNEYLMKMSADDMLANGYKYLNVGEDLGVEGLRSSKQSFRPVQFIKKYNIYKASVS